MRNKDRSDQIRPESLTHIEQQLFVLHYIQSILNFIFKNFISKKSGKISQYYIKKYIAFNMKHFKYSTFCFL